MKYLSKPLPPEDPMCGCWDRWLVEADEQKLQVLRSLPAVIHLETGESFSLVQFKEHCISCGYGSRETMETLFPDPAPAKDGE